MVDIPSVLVGHIRDANLVLLLGAGASKGALHPNGMSPPDGTQLANMIVEKFLEPTFRDRPLDQVAALAISERSLTDVQEFVAEIYRPFEPAIFHELIPTFRWSAIATTNYDLVIERAYAKQLSPVQKLVPFTKNGERIEEKLRAPNSLVYLKLHGCITKTSDTEIPLILTPEQYITHRHNRSRLFERLHHLACEQPILVVGHSLADIDLRQLLLELSAQGDCMPRSYLVAPQITDTESRFWSSKRFTVLKCTFEELLKALDAQCPRNTRILSGFRSARDHPITKRLQLSPGTSLPTNLAEYLHSSADYIYDGMPSVTCNPVQFYKGHFQGWPEIQGNLDVKRGITDTILEEVILPTEAERRNRQELVLVRGHAGSGKTVSLFRLAWEAATSLESLCLFSRQIKTIQYEAIRDLYHLAKCRIFLFVDGASENKDSILYVMRSAQRDHLQLTIITAERFNEWTAHCDCLEPYKTRSYSLQYLSEQEIDELIALLARHKSLGYMATLSNKERHEALSEKAGRNLLVALHEATLGRPFSDLILDEFKSIPDVRAQLLYRTICILHRLHVPVRAGLISRVHGIPYASFRKDLFAPLEEVVFAKKSEGETDYYYHSRHPHIADIVFERTLQDPKDRLDEYLRIISCLDVDFNADRNALRGLAHARELGKLFPDLEMARRVFAAAKLRDSQNASLLQQEALLEMHLGSTDTAYSLLQEAIRLQPNNLTIQHTLAELSLARSERSIHPLEKKKYRREATQLAASLLKRGTLDSYAHHTLLKISFAELEETVGNPSEALFSNCLRDFEKRLSEARQIHPGDSFILDMEAKCAELLNNHPQAITSLRVAFNNNKSSTYLAIRLARLLEHADKKIEAMEILKESLDSSPGDKELHFRMAMLLDEQSTNHQATIVYHLRSSFVEGDTRYIAQFWYARAQFLFGDRLIGEAAFRTLADANVDYREKVRRRGEVQGKLFYGVVERLDSRFAFVARDGDAAKIYARLGDCRDGNWSELYRGARVEYGLSFNYFGPIAIDLAME